ncbi:hypothetical protein Ddye_021689 [Dipteronia dyeriana]|uniref:Tetraspanin-15 n=1 Tax=Dipteronia dyeriana TaxID=168575 RepID=A0AAD9U242_9ROSI|nr:hypothetical protein Ddye_032714 [Dipteronia dyeriana]KAK2646494.1 hypothetical protein Ddye_021689 [Dipteronia dyeriana]
MADPTYNTTEAEAVPAEKDQQKITNNNNPEIPPMADTKPDPAPASPPNTKAKNLAGLLTIVCFILSFPVIASVIWLFYMRDFDCEGLLRLPRLQTGIGIALIFVFIISNAALFLRSRFPMPGVIMVMVPLILMLTAGLALVGAYDMESRKIPASPRWFRLKVDNNNNWNNIKSCIYDTGDCDDLQSRFFTLKSYDFSTSKLTSIESGCCKPPAICGMEFINATFWRRREEREPLEGDQDCETWNNDRTIQCYNCQSCKDGFLRTLKSKWWKLGIFLVLMALLLIVFHLLVFLATMWERF